MPATRPNRLAVVEDLSDEDVGCCGCARNLVSHLLRQKQHTPSAAMNTLALGLSMVIASTRPAPDEVEAFLAAIPGVLRAQLDALEESNREALRDAEPAGRA